MTLWYILYPNYLFDVLYACRSGNSTIEYDDLIAYAEETADFVGIRDAGVALDILDIDGDGKIGLLDFIHFAGRLKRMHLNDTDPQVKQPQ